MKGKGLKQSGMLSSKLCAALNSLPIYLEKEPPQKGPKVSKTSTLHVPDLTRPSGRWSLVGALQLIPFPEKLG